MSSLLLKGGRLIDPAHGLDETADLLLVDGKVAAIGGDALGQAPEGTPEIDVTGKVACPGLIDIHVHFREPGQTAQGDYRHRRGGGGARRFHHCCLHAQHEPGDR